MTENESTYFRKITTTLFGELEIQKKNIFYFTEGLFGYENLSEFVLVSDEDNKPFKWLQSIEKPEISFLLINPLLIDNSYSPGKDFNFEKSAILVVVTMDIEKKQLIANMKAPVILDMDEQQGEQVIIASDKYSVTMISK
ncbi:flagellar assembly protein FliW [Bacteroidota bacterium]